jgi:hypothetical protein
MGAAAIRLLNSTDQAFVGGPRGLALLPRRSGGKSFHQLPRELGAPYRAAGGPATSLRSVAAHTLFQIRIASTSPPRRIPLTEWPFRLRNIEARIGYPEHFAQHRELTGTRAPGLGCI